MFEIANLHADLSFLNEVLGDKQAKYRRSCWLQSDFDAPEWRFRFVESLCIEVDFRVRLDDGTLLTDPRHRELLEVFKFWQLIQVHPASHGGKPCAPIVAYQKVTRTLHLIDYCLLNAGRFGLAKNGLACITENDFVELCTSIARKNETAQAIYDWNSRLAAFLKTKVENTPVRELETVIEQNPSLKEVHIPEEDRYLDMTDRQLVLCKAWLFSFGYYKRNQKKDFAKFPNTEKLAREIYKDTLWGKTKKPILPELGISPQEFYHREKIGVPIRKDEDDTASTSSIHHYAQALKSLTLVASLGLAVPRTALNALNVTSVLTKTHAALIGRYKSLPFPVALQALRKSIEFALEYGDALTQSYLRLVEAAQRESLPCGVFLQRHGIEQYLHPKVSAYGVRAWTVRDYFGTRRAWKTTVSKEDYFQALRSNRGLWELLSVLFGSIAVCVGALSARRQGELLDLPAGSCLDSSHTNLIFQNRKSGLMGLRTTEARPIPPIAVRMIRMLQRFHERLQELNITDTKVNLFSTPGQFGNRVYQSGHSRYNTTLDIFCDYFEIPLDQSGRRFYIRQHQLRRFFAMMFFWGSSMHGMETLRWFLGHTNIEHLYYYITESIPGEVLRSVKAQFAGERLREGAEDAERLGVLLRTRFGTDDFSVLDNEELDEYIEELMADGMVEVEPYFFDTSDGESYRILIKVTTTGNER